MTSKPGKAGSKTSSGGSDLFVRIRSAAVYTIINVVLLLAGNVPTTILMMITAGICAQEFFRMVNSDAGLTNSVLGVIVAALYPLTMYLAGLSGTMVLTIAYFLVLAFWYVFNLRLRLSDVAATFFGPLYTGLMLSGLVAIRCSVGTTWGGVFIIALFLSVWANDSLAYLVGRKIGKHKMAPKISPKKSWEGFFAGLIGSIALWCLMSLIPGFNMGIPYAVLCGVVCGVAGVVGDLFESRIKRNCGVKDSGTIMPGHGGLLDRSDSLAMVSVVAAALLIAGGCIPYEGIV